MRTACAPRTVVYVSAWIQMLMPKANVELDWFESKLLHFIFSYVRGHFMFISLSFVLILFELFFWFRLSVRFMQIPSVSRERWILGSMWENSLRSFFLNTVLQLSSHWLWLVVISPLTTGKCHSFVMKVLLFSAVILKMSLNWKQ